MYFQLVPRPLPHLKLLWEWPGDVHVVRGMRACDTRTLGTTGIRERRLFLPAQLGGRTIR